MNIQYAICNIIIIQARLAKNKKKLASICHPITHTPVTKIRLWASFGVQIRTIDGGHKKNFFNAFPPQKP